MKCLFGHQWNGCKCKKCGKTRNEKHSWQGLKCNVCGAECFDGNDLKAMAEICGIAAGFGVFRAEANAQILEIGEKILSRSDFAKDDMFLIMVCMQMFGASYDAILKNNPQCKSALAQIPLFTSKITEYNRRKGYIDGNWPDITKFFKNGISPDDISKGNFISATKKNTNLTNVQTSLETKPDLDKQESQKNSQYTSNKNCEIQKPRCESGLKNVTIFMGHRSAGQLITRNMNPSEIDAMLNKLADPALAQRIRIYAKNNKVDQQMLGIRVPNITSQEEFAAFVNRAFPVTSLPPFADIGVVLGSVICYFIVAEKA